MNPLDGLKLFAMYDPYASGFSSSQLRDVMYQLTADPLQEELLLETESFAVIDSALVVGEPITSRVDNFILDALATSYARFPRVMKFLERSLNTAISSEGITVTGHEIGKPKKNNLFATVAVNFSLSDGQAITVVFHAPDEDPKVFKADDMVIAFRWMLNKRDITQVVAPEMAKGKMKDLSVSVIGKRVGQLVKANSKAFIDKQGKVQVQRDELAQAQNEANSLAAQVEQLNQEIAALESENDEAQGKIVIIQEQVDLQIAHNDDLRARIAALKGSESAGTSSTTTTTVADPTQTAEYENRNPNVNAYISSLVTNDANKAKARSVLEKSVLVQGLFGGSASDMITQMVMNGWTYDAREGKGKKTKYIQPNSTRYVTNYTKIVLDFAKFLGMQEYKPQQQEAVTPTPQPTTIEQVPEAAQNLQNIVDGLHDDVDVDDIWEMIEQSVNELESLGLIEQYDDLLGAAAQKYAELVNLQNEVV